MIRSVKPKRRPLPDASDDRPYRVFMISTFWVAVLGVALLFFAPWWGAGLLVLCVIAFVFAVLFGG